MNQLQKNAIRALLGVAIVLTISGVTNAQPKFEDEVEKIDVMSGTIAGIVALMTDVAILPMGISASMKTFRHIVLNNV